MTRFLATPLAALVLFAAAAEAESEGVQPITVIVSKEWEGPGALDLTTLRRIYLGQQTRAGGHRVRPFNLPLGSREREVIARTALEESADALEHYWIRQALEAGPLTLAVGGFFIVLLLAVIFSTLGGVIGGAAFKVQPAPPAAPPTAGGMPPMPPAPPIGGGTPPAPPAPR